MELALIFRELWGRKRLLLLGVVVSAFGATLAVYRVNGLFPPKLQPRSLEYSAASTVAFLDAQQSFVGDLSQQIGPLVNRATILANLMAGPGAVSLIGQFSGIPQDRIYVAGPVDPDQQRVVQEPTAAKRNVQVTGETRPYRVEFLADRNLPTIEIYTQAPGIGQAVRLADAAVHALSVYVQTLQQQQRFQPNTHVVIRKVGTPSAGIVNGGIKKKLAGLVFFLIFPVWCVLVLIGVRARSNWRSSDGGGTTATLRRATS
jgi:hypothetical protein